MYTWQKQVLWSWMANTYHREPYVGHSIGRAKDCHECRKFVAFAESLLARTIDNPEGNPHTGETPPNQRSTA